MNLQETLLNYLEEPVAFEGVELVDIEITGGSGKKTVVIYIDKEGGVTIDDCERVSKKVSVLLDVHDIIPFAYRLEVSSPGLSRPLKTKKDFTRNRNVKVAFHLREPFEGSQKIIGVILSVEEDGVTVMKGTQEVFLPFALIVKGSIVIDF